MAKLLAVNTKRKDLEGVHGEAFDFSLFSQPKKIKGLDADLPRLMEVEEDSSGASLLEQEEEETQNHCSMQAVCVVMAGILNEQIVREDIVLNVEEQMKGEEEEEGSSMEVEEEGGVSQQYEMKLQVPPSKPTAMLWSGEEEFLPHYL